MGESLVGKRRSFRAVLLCVMVHGVMLHCVSITHLAHADQYACETLTILSPLDAALCRIDALEAQVQNLSVAADLAPSQDGCCELVKDCVVCPGWEASAELLYYKVRQRGLDFAVTEDGTALMLGEGQVHSLDFDRDGGIRAAVGYRTKTKWAVRGVYTHFTTDGLAYAERPDGIGQLFPTRSQPDGAQEADTARMAGTFDYQVFDLQADRPFYDTRFATLTCFGGLRWIDIEQDFRYDYDGRDFTNGRIIDRTRVDGIGLRMGGEARWRMAGGVSAFGSLAGGLVYGQYESHFYEDNLDGNVVITDVVDEFDQALASLDARAGVAWTWRGLTVSGGYEMANWFNLADRATYVDDIQEATYVPAAQDVLLEGLFLQLTYVR